MTTDGPGSVPRDSIVRTALLCAAVATCVALLVLIWIGTYSRLIADDFCTSADVVQRGTAAAVAHWYRTWSGRFAYHILAAIAGASALAARILPGLTIIGLAGSTIFAAKRVTRAPWLTAIALGLALTWSILGCAPDIFQVVFWASGTITYSIPLILIAAWIGLTLRSGGAHFFPGSHALLFFAAGFSETMTSVLAGAVGLAFVSWPERRRALAGGLAAVIAGAILMVAAPGNAGRASRFAHPEGSGASMVGLDASEFVQVEALIAGLSMLLVFSVAAAGASSGGAAPAPVRRGVVAAAVIAVLWGVAVPLLMARTIMAVPAPLRSLEPTHALLAGTFALAGWQVGRRWPKGAPVAAVAVVLLVIPLLRDLRELTSMADGAAVFAREWDAMDESLQAKRGGPAVVVHAPAKVGRLDFVNPSSKHWANRCLARYYGIGQIAGDEGPAGAATSR